MTVGLYKRFAIKKLGNVPERLLNLPDGQAILPRSKMHYYLLKKFLTKKQVIAVGKRGAARSSLSDSDLESLLDNVLGAESISAVGGKKVH